METKEILGNYYGNYDEDGRLRSRHGMVEFLTTMRYVRKYLRQQFPVTQLQFVATDGYTNHIRDVVDAMDEKTYEVFLNYHFATCERPDMIGYSHHTIDVFRKDG